MVLPPPLHHFSGVPGGFSLLVRYIGLDYIALVTANTWSLNIKQTFWFTLTASGMKMKWLTIRSHTGPYYHIHWLLPPKGRSNLRKNVLPPTAYTLLFWTLCFPGWVLLIGPKDRNPRAISRSSATQAAWGLRQLSSLPSTDLNCCINTRHIALINGKSIICK